MPGHETYRAFFFTSRRQSDPVSLRRTIICLGKLQGRYSMCCRHRRPEFQYGVLYMSMYVLKSLIIWKPALESLLSHWCFYNESSGHRRAIKTVSRTCLTQPRFHSSDHDLDLHASAAFETRRGIKEANVCPHLQQRPQGQKGRQVHNKTQAQAAENAAGIEKNCEEYRHVPTHTLLSIP